ncbi:hypothetical protein LB566_26725 [Mesorhizobium sp. CA13]|uniref:hypothetical protein n=1 Tax=unclassified Mesorhizobium TaxID=325217 RepID=UPI00112853E7|nr:MULTISPECIES: hypothetical protein [unclassified Mesorhizobium]MBZ9857388.1 hypothetical protein [Mesorhizobium sp. CA13]MBZ9967775.1 hypothetical protein [Mesorhizobium sp. BR1-1-2]MCA0016396.1 hypothetical protein [Mesorhizobium sp. B294B1A1]MCA0038443.1 hypothetical protein [Mesorhizobium sp. B292B1B]TPM37327.1 hypothetical protein FJ964_29805 [Mesorhizobium sp. B2-3-2]
MKTVPQGLIAMCGIMLLAGCGTAKEKTAPCKRPASLMSYATPAAGLECGPMQALNGDEGAARALIGDLPARSQ